MPDEPTERMSQGQAAEIIRASKPPLNAGEFADLLAAALAALGILPTVTRDKPEK